MNQALVGIRVLDCTRLLPFAFGSQLLADLGADVVKVEAPGGEYGRAFSAIFALSNRNKRSITLNLSHPTGQALFRELAAKADVVFESFRPGVMAGFGLDYEALRAVNPALVYCSAAGYGQTGPYRLRPGHDLNYLSVAGIVQPTADRPPVVPTIPVADMAVGIFSAYCILAALFHARATGVGQHVDIGMTDLALALNVVNVAGAVTPAPSDASAEPLDLSGCAPYYGVYRTADGQYLSIGNVEAKFWEAFLTVIGRLDLLPDRTAVGDRARAVREEIQRVIETATLREWEERLAGAEVCFAPVRTAAEALRDPQLLARDMVRHDAEGKVQVAFPAKFSATPARSDGRVPEAGEHNEEIFGQLGYGPGDLARWRVEGII